MQAVVVATYFNKHLDKAHGKGEWTILPALGVDQKYAFLKSHHSRNNKLEHDTSHDFKKLYKFTIGQCNLEQLESLRSEVIPHFNFTCNTPSEVAW